MTRARQCPVADNFLFHPPACLTILFAKIYYINIVRVFKFYKSIDDRLLIVVSRYCHMSVDRNVSTHYCWSLSGDDVDWLSLIISSTVAVCDWCISILAVVVNDWRISILIVLTRSCSLTSPLWYRSAVVLFDRRHPPFWNFNSAIPIDILRVKSNVSGFLNPTGVPVWVSVK